MSQPGWYPDPAGAPGHLRYWDGTSWGHDTTTNPRPSPPPSSPRAPRNRTWVVVAVVLVALALLGALVWQQASDSAGPDTNSSTPTVTGWDETSSGTPSPEPSDSPSPSTGVPVDCPTTREGPLSVVNGRIKGTISAAVIDGWRMTDGFGIPGVRQELGQTLPVTATWVNVSLVGNAYREDGFTSAQSTARMITECFTSSAHYPGDSSKKEIVSEAVDVEGHPGHHIRTEVYVTNQGPDIKGGVVDIVAVDTGDPQTIGVYLSAVNIGDADTQAQADQVRATLCVRC